MAIDVPVIVESYGNGYRPSGEGTIGGRRFYFRMNGSGDWAFGVEHADAPPESWALFLTADEDLQFFIDGSQGGSLYHTEALPVFVDAIGRYLHHVGVEDLDTVLGEVKAQARVRMTTD
jgi:hypothetical protein